LAQAAQHLLNLEGITTTAVFALADDTIYLAARSKDIRMNIGKVLHDAFGEMGDTAGPPPTPASRFPSASSLASRPARTAATRCWRSQKRRCERNCSRRWASTVAVVAASRRTGS